MSNFPSDFVISSKFSLHLHEHILNHDMKKSILLILCASLFVFTGCDFFRTLAGRSTSEQIEMIKAELLRVGKADEVCEDSLCCCSDTLVCEYEVVSDSVEFTESDQYAGSELNSAELGGLFATKLEAKYYVVIGAFKLRSNAERLLVKAREAGYEPALISFNNGLLAVGVCPCDNIADAKIQLNRVKQESFCPKDVWLMLN